MNSLEAFELLKTLIESVNEKTNSLTQQLSQYDLEQQDILHFIENRKLNAAQMSKLFKLLKGIRENRRNIKQELSRYTSLASRMSKGSNLLECKLELKPEEEFYELRTDVLNHDFGFTVGSKMYFGETSRVVEKKDTLLEDSIINTEKVSKCEAEEQVIEGSDIDISTIMSHPEGQKIILTDTKTGAKVQCNNFEKAVARAIGGTALTKLKPTDLIKNISGAMKAIKLGNEYLGYKWEVK